MSAEQKKMPAVVRLELPAALVLERIATAYANDHELTAEQEAALEKFEQRIREAESRS